MHIDWKPDTTKLRQFGYFGGCFIIAILAISVWTGSRVLEGAGFTYGTILIGAAGLLFLLGSVAPVLLKPAFIGLSVITFPIGFVMNFLVLGLLFYGIFTPMALIFRLFGRDAMERKIDKTQSSYWKKVQRTRSPESYYQPF